MKKTYETPKFDVARLFFDEMMSVGPSVPVEKTAEVDGNNELVVEEFDMD